MVSFLKKKKSSRSVSSTSMTRQKSKKQSKQSKSLPPSVKFQEPTAIDNDDRAAGCCVSCISLGTGRFTASGVYSIILFSHNGRLPSPHGNPHMPSKIFIRTADLPHMEVAVAESRHLSFSDLAEDEWVDHVHKPSSNPPLEGMEHDVNESWVALDDGKGKKAPLAEAAVAALVKTGLDASLNKDMWTANGCTAKILKSGIWNDTLFLPYDESIPNGVPVPHAKGSKGENDVLVWSGTFGHSYYGNDLPAIRCEAIVNMSPKSLATLLVDSSRVKEYNKMSVGRDDIMVLREDDKVVTKIIVGKSKPPMLGKTLVLKSLLHMEELPGGEHAGYVIVSRAIAHADEVKTVEDPKVIESEMLMGLNIIRAVEGEPDRCILINLNHLSSPMIPMMFAKRLGLGAAVNFINDIRALC